jgi:hypothetical protein
MIMREIRPDSGRELLTIMGKVSDQRSAFMIVSGKRFETGRLGLTIMEHAGGWPRTP